MNIVWLSWKDPSHPEAGGAEVVQNEICKRLVADGHQVVLLTSRSEDAPAEEEVDGYVIRRKGSYRYTVYPAAFWRYRTQYRKWADVIIEEFNTAPFFARFYARKKRILLIHQLTRQIWFYQYFQPISTVGYFLEPHIINAMKSKHVIAMSPSTKRDLVRYGYKPETVSVMSEGIKLEAVDDPVAVEKHTHPSVIAYGGIRPMKRTLDIVKAFELAKEELPKLTLTIAGSTQDDYAEQVKQYVAGSRYKSSIRILGRIPEARKATLLSEHHFLLAAAVKEGWGLTITEAASQGTPAIAYDVDGQRDAVKYGYSGILVPPAIEDMAEAIVEGFSPTFNYQQLQIRAWRHSKQINFDQAYRDFTQVLGRLKQNKKT